MNPSPQLDSSAPASPSSDAGVALRLGLWRRHWRDIKLHALAFRFYQNQAWQVQEGDWYTITRYGPMLYRVSLMGPSSIRMDHLSNDDGFTGTAKAPLLPTTWDAQEFCHGGFAENRIHIPEWIWEEAVKWDSQKEESK